MKLELDDVAVLLREAAAEEVVPRFRSLGEGDKRRKDGGELVTIVDEAVEVRLTPALEALLPGSLVVGEEATAADPSLLQKLGGGESVWVIDPIDGTENFAAGREAFAIMVALIVGRETRMAWIYDVVGKRMAMAELGAGAWIEGERQRLGQNVPFEAQQGTLHGGRFGGPELARKIERLRERLAPLRSLRCAGLEYIRLAAGGAHYTLFTKLMPWDHAPGALLFREAGGIARQLDREPYEAHRYEGPALLLARDEASWHRLHTMITEA